MMSYYFAVSGCVPSSQNTPAGRLLGNEDGEYHELYQMTSEEAYSSAYALYIVSRSLPLF